ncbi:MAG: ribosome-associated translation inhibitor RaiA [Clostridia bacterium]|nr:ribosome-associated translation inhibitor RaiA [Clostridia bacterium]
MTINFSERKMSVENKVKAYAEKKCGKLDRYFDKETDVVVAFSNERGMDTAEITVRSGGMIFRAQEKTTDMYASIDGALASIDRQIQKNKTRLAKRMRQDSFVQAMDFMTDYRDEEIEILREKEVDSKPMTAEDAILQMNLLGHSFFFFLNSENGRYCVVYRRDYGGYGMLIAK